MPHPGILYPSPTKDGWQEFTFHNYQAHLAVDAALLSARNIAVANYRLWPVTEHDFQDWLSQHSMSHQAYNAALGISGDDLSGLDMKNKSKRDDWFYQHYTQHVAITEILGLSSL